MSCPILNSNYTNLDDYLTNGNNEYSYDQLMACVTTDSNTETVVNQYFGYIQDIFTKLDRYNKAQACWKRYKTQSSIGSSSSGNQGWVNPIDDSTANEYCERVLPQSEKDKPELTNLTTYTNLNTAITNYETWLLSASGTPSKSNKDIIQDLGISSDISISELTSKHKEIKNLRNSLETSLKELRLDSNSNAKDSKLELDSNIYVSLLWTTLATGIVYYTFTAL